jgi:hypothetical protein
MYFSRALIVPLSISMCLAAQTTPAAGDQKQTIKIGIALMANRSGRQTSPTWERDQLVRELQRKRTDRKSAIVFDVVSLQGSSKEDAEAEAAEKNCVYVVLTTMVDPHRNPGISEGPDGIAHSPVIIGNTKLGQVIAIDFVILEVSDLRDFAEGTSTASVEEGNETRAADEAMRMTANRVASELRKDRASKID